MDNSCIVCRDGEKGVKEIARARAAKTAHVLAMKEADKEEIKPFTWVEVYQLYFKRIYDHEYARNEWVERERAQTRLRKEHGWSSLCEYHGEFDEGFCRKVARDVEKQYAKSKWPNPFRN